MRLRVAIGLELILKNRVSGRRRMIPTGIEKNGFFSGVESTILS